MSQFYTQQAYGLWPQVWPVPDTKVIKGYEQFLYRLMIIVGTIFTIAFVLNILHYSFRNRILYSRVVND